MENGQDRLMDEVFNLLKRLGPLCASQLSAEVGVKVSVIERELLRLVELGLVEQRADKDTTREYSEPEKPWGIRRPFRSRRQVPLQA